MTSEETSSIKAHRRFVGTVLRQLLRGKVVYACAIRDSDIIAYHDDSEVYRGPIADFPKGVSFNWAQISTNNLIAMHSDGVSDRPISTLPDLQAAIAKWVVAAFGEETAKNVSDRAWRFIEETFELAQALEIPREYIIKLLDYVYNRPVGETKQELGSTFLTLAGLASAMELSLDAAARAELSRVWGKIDAIRAKQAGKIAASPLPGPSPDASEPDTSDIPEVGEEWFDKARFVPAPDENSEVEVISDEAYQCECPPSDYHICAARNCPNSCDWDDDGFEP